MTDQMPREASAPVAMLSLLQGMHARIQRAFDALIDGEDTLATDVLDDLLADIDDQFTSLQQALGSRSR